MTVSKILLLAALCEVRGKVSGDFLEPILQSKGICSAALMHITFEKGDVRDSQIAYLNMLSALFSGWPDHSGESEYPVPAIDCGDDDDTEHEIVASSAYYRAYDQGDMWYGEYGDKRRELLDYAIDTLKKELTQ